MGVAAYNRGSLVISRQFCEAGGCRGCDRCRKIVPTPRPASWGDKARTRAMDRARRLIASGLKAGLRPLTVDMLAAILQERERVGEATARGIAREALHPEGGSPNMIADEDEIITPEMRERADAVVAEMRRRWAAQDAQTDEANRAFDAAFRKALRQPAEPKGGR